MALNPARITAINTADDGANGQQGQSAGFDGGSPPDATETISGDSFNDPSATLSLFPAATGGYGGGGAQGSRGANGVGTQNGPTTEWSPGGAGGPGGNGATGAAASLTMTQEAIGSATTYYGGPVSISLQSVAGQGGNGGAGGGGGVSGDVSPTSEGAAGGSGGSGGSGGTGGAASAVLKSVTAYGLEGQVYRLSATAGSGGGTLGISGYFGSPGGTPSNGGTGGYGGDGGSATATIAGNIFYDTESVGLYATARGGQGGDGGNGGAGGPGVNAEPDLTTYDGGLNGAGGNGGNGGSASSTISGNVVDTPVITVQQTDDIAAGGFGGTGGVEGGVSTPTQQYSNNPPGADGVAGHYGSDPLTLTDNQFILGSGIAGVALADAANSKMTLNLGETYLPGQNGTPAGGPIPLDGAAGGNLVFSGNSFTGNGTSTLQLDVQGGGVTADTLHGTLSIGGSAGNAMTGFNQFFLGEGDRFIAGAGNYTVDGATGAAPDTLVFTAESGDTKYFDAGQAGDLQLQFSGFGTALDTLAQLQADTSVSGFITYIDTPGGGELAISSGDFTESAADVSFAPLCFCAGTQIETVQGAVAVEDLQIGDCVITAHHGPQPIKWIGRRCYDARFIAGHPLVLPVCIKADAIAAGVPRRDLWVSPGHGIQMDAVLVPAWLLVNGVSIIQELPGASVAYLHIELEEHEILSAEGCPSESYLDEGRRGQFHNAAEFGVLYPLAPAAAVACLQRVESGFHLQALQRRVAERAGIAAEPVRLGALDGFVDQAGPAFVSGWAQDGVQPERPVCLDILVAGRRVASVLANAYRDDLRRAGRGSGKHSFEIRLPPGLAGPVEVRRAIDQAMLPFTTAAFTQAA